MPSTEILVKGIIEIMARGSGAKEAAAQMKGVILEAQKLRKETEATERSVQGIGSKIGQYLGGLAVGAYIKSAVVEFAHLERSFNSLGFVMNQLGIDASRNLPMVKAFLEGLGAEHLQESVPAFQKFLGITRDVNAAMYMTSLAVDVAKNKNMALAESSSLLAGAIQGKAMAAVQQLGIHLEKGTGAASRNAQAIAGIMAQYEGFASTLTDTSEQIDEMEGTWTRLKLRAGETFAIMVPYLNKAWEAVSHFFGHLTAEVASMAEIPAILAAVFDVKKLATDGWDAYAGAVKGALANSQRVFQDTLEQYEKDSEKSGTAAGKMQEEAKEKARKIIREMATAEDRKTQEEADAKLAEQRKKMDRQTMMEMLRARVQAIADGTPARLEAELAVLREQRRQDIEDAKDAKGDIAEINRRYDDQELNLRQQNALKAAELTFKAQQELERAKIESAQEGSDARFALELDYLARARDVALREVQGLSDAELAIRASFLVAKDALEQRHREQTAQRNYDAVKADHDSQIALEQAVADAVLSSADTTAQEKYETQKRLLDLQFQNALEEADAQYRVDVNAAGLSAEQKEAIHRDYIRTLAAINVKHNADESSLDKKHIANQKQMRLQLASMWLAVAGTIFKNNKAVAVAETIINTAGAVMKTMEEMGYPAGVPFAAAVAALGAAQVAKILSTEPGSGGAGGVDSGGAGASAAASAASSSSRTWTPGYTNMETQRAGETRSPSAAEASGDEHHPPTGIFSSVTMNFNAPVMGGKEGAAELVRVLREAERRDRGRYQQ